MLTTLITAALCLGVSTPSAFAETPHEPAPEDGSLPGTESADSNSIQAEPLIYGTDASALPLAASVDSSLNLPAMRTDMLGRVNQLRSTHGASAVVAADSMHDVAQGWAEYMARTGAYWHNPNLRYELPAGWWAAAENIDTLPPSQHQYSPTTIVTLHMARWEESPGHFINMKNSAYTHAGFGFALASSGEVYSVQVFAGYTVGYGPTPSQPLIIAGTPSITGVPQAGKTLTAARGTWTSTNPITYSYQWKRNGTPIPGATAQNYRVVTADEGQHLTVTVTGSAPDSTTRSATSAPVTIPAAAWPVSVRLAGQDRFATAVEISRSEFLNPSSVRGVVLATGFGFADALSASPLAASLGGPLLLTQQDTIPRVTADELHRLRPSEVIIVGGEAAVGVNVERQLRDSGFNVRRLSGSDRYETSAEIAAHTEERTGVKANEIFLATGQNFPDALSASAAAANSRFPVLLTEGAVNSLGRVQLDFLTSRNIETVHIAGGSATISPNIANQLTQLGIEVVRYAGADRIETSSLIARAFASQGATIHLAHGWNFPDALAGAAVAHRQNAVLLLTDQGCLSQQLVPTISSLSPNKIMLLGGPSALSPEVASYRVCS